MVYLWKYDILSYKRKNNFNIKLIREREVINLKIFYNILLKIGIIISFILILIVIVYLRKKDSEIDYSKKEIKFFIFEVNGVMKLVIPYYMWQLGKRNYIENNYKDEFEFKVKKYLVISPAW